MSIEHWAAFVIASSILLIIPGPTILTVISYSIAHGKRATAPLIFAVALGDATALFLSLVGLGALLSTSAWLFTVVKWAGGLYLVCLGMKLLLSGGAAHEAPNAESANSRLSLFINTWLVTALNPKGILFFIAFLPQFIDPKSGLVSQLWVLSITFVALAAINTSLYTLFAARARRILTSPRANRRFKYGGGCLLTLAGAWALMADKPSQP